MAVPASTSEFLDLLNKSGVADQKKLEGYLLRQQSSGVAPTDPKMLAALLVRDGYLTQFQAEQLLAGKWKRFSIGKYKVLERLGSGGMGSVFLCEHKLMRRRVAVKVLPTAKAADQAALDRFYREARAVAALDHPNIVHAYDIDQDENLHFLVMEYVDGASLQEIIKRAGPIDVLRSCHYMKQSALGLEHAHISGLVHRDIKPANILIDRTGQVKILDMGLARFFNDEEDILTRKYDENVLGTADYLAPEQAVDSHVVDIRADIYGLGATFYFILTGKTPFGEGTIAQKLMWHQSKMPKPIHEVMPTVPESLWAIIAKMMAKEPKDRFQRPEEIAHALEPFTRTPIGPPPEKEMPHLSLAATGVAPVAVADPDTTISTGSGTPLPNLGVKAMPIAPGSKGSGKAVATPAPATPAPARPATPAPTPAARASGLRPIAPAPITAGPPLPQPILTTAPSSSSSATLEEKAPWESLTDTVDPALKADTQRSGRRLAVTPPKVNQDQRQKAIRIASIAAGIGLFVLAALTVKYIFFAPSTQPHGPVARPKLEVGQNVTPGPFAFKSIQAALRSAKAGDIIELLDPEHKESLVVEGRSNMATDVTIQAAPGIDVVWTPARKEEVSPILRLSGAKNFHIKGKGITLDGNFDGKRKVNDLVLLTGKSPGLRLEDLQFKGFGKTAVTIFNLAGSAEAPVKLANLQTTTISTEKPAAAIFLDANPSVDPRQNVFIEIHPDCQFQGIDPAKAIKSRDPSVNGEGVSLK